MLKFEMPKNQSSIIKVLGVGGGGSNAVNHMQNQGITGVDFIVCNTDAQALDMSPVPNKIALGKKGLGAGSVPEVAQKAAIDKADEIRNLLSSNTEMLFITAGMGGGTGTGAAPEIAKIAKEIDLEDEEVNKILVIAIVTLPFSFEGRKRKKQAEKGIIELKQHADAVLIISNDKLRELYGNLGLSEAFKIADDVLLTAAKGIAEIITVRANVNIDFKDVNTVMKNSGVAIMGTGVAEGTDRARVAIEMALKSPLLDDNDIKGTDDILLYLSSGNNEISMDEITEITEYILNEAGSQAEIIWGAGRNESLGDQISVTVVATGFDKIEDENDNRKVTGLYGNVKPKEVKTPVITPPRPTRPADEIPLKEDDDSEEEINLMPPKEKREQPIAPPVSTPSASEEKAPVIRFTLDGIAPEPTERELSKETIAPVDEITEIKESESMVNEQEEPLLKKKETNIQEPATKEDREAMEKKSNERVERLRQMSIQLKSPGGLSDLETEPAYRRKKVELSEEKPSEEAKVSKFTLSEGDENGAELKSDNSYLHDNVD
ncbi:MAG: cell division protein FtsZ [Bacteroidota bacterium]